jgi:hypothetical protein
VTRPMSAADVAGEAEDGNGCPRPDCGLPPASGTRTDRHPGTWQHTTILRLACEAGHTWTTHTDGS